MEYLSGKSDALVRRKGLNLKLFRHAFLAGYRPKIRSLAISETAYDAKNEV
jgi:hypothetical protein